MALTVVDVAKTAHAAKSVRAASAHLLAPVVANEVVWQVRAGGERGLDAVHECRLAIDEAHKRAPAQGAAVKVYFGSNGMVLGPIAGARHVSRRAPSPAHWLATRG